MEMPQSLPDAIQRLGEPEVMNFFMNGYTISRQAPEDDDPRSEGTFRGHASL
jgi:hypothetical protein